MYVDNAWTFLAPAVTLTLPDDLHTRTWPVFSGDIPLVQTWTSYVKSSRLSKVSSERHTYRQTGSKLYTTPLHRWSVITTVAGRWHLRSADSLCLVVPRTGVQIHKWS